MPMLEPVERVLVLAEPPGDGAVAQFVEITALASHRAPLAVAGSVPRDLLCAALLHEHFCVQKSACFMK